MPNGEQPTPGDLFEFVMSQLTELQATELIGDIRRSIERGVVAQEQAQTSKTFRPMNDEEKLSVALESIVSAFDVPIMLARCKHIFGCDEVVWANETVDQKHGHASPPPSDGRQSDILSKLVATVDEIHLPIPEVA